MPATTTEYNLPDGVSPLIAVARIAHRDGNRALEQSAVDKLTHDYGIDVRFTCAESVARDLENTRGNG